MIIALSFFASITLASVCFWVSKEARWTGSNKLKVRAKFLYIALPLPQILCVVYFLLDRRSILDGLISVALIVSIVIHLIWLYTGEPPYDDGELSWRDLGEVSPILGFVVGLTYLILHVFIS